MKYGAIAAVGHMVCHTNLKEITFLLGACGLQVCLVRGGQVDLMGSQRKEKLGKKVLKTFG
jgi:hypothetical protein